MATQTDLDLGRFVNNRTNVVVLKGKGSKRRETVYLGNDRRVFLDFADVGQHEGNQLIVNLLLQNGYFLLGSQDLRLVGLELLGDVAFGGNQGLLADPLFRDLVLVRVSNFDIVAKHIVECNFETADSCSLNLSFYDFLQILFA